MEFKNVKSIIGPNGKDVTKITRKSDNVVLWQKGHIYSNLNWLCSNIQPSASLNKYFPLVYLDTTTGGGQDLFNFIKECLTNKKTFRLRFLSDTTFNTWTTTSITTTINPSLTVVFSTTGSSIQYQHKTISFSNISTTKKTYSYMIGSAWEGTCSANDWSDNFSFTYGWTFKYFAVGLCDMSSAEITSTDSATQTAERLLEYSTLNGCGIEVEVVE